VLPALCGNDRICSAFRRSYLCPPLNRTGFPVVPKTLGRSAAHVAAAGLLLAAAALVGWELLPERRVLRDGPSHAAFLSDVLRPVGHLHRLRAAFVTRDNRIFAIEDHQLYSSSDGGRSFSLLGQLPELDPSWHAQILDRLARTKLGRALHGNDGPSNIVALSTGTILVFYDRIYRSDDGGRSFNAVFDPAAFGFSGPAPGAQNVAVGEDDSVYYGEYKTGPRPHGVHILRGADDGRDWTVAHRFPPGHTFHVHSVQFDQYRNRYWVMTGDRDEESAVYYTEDDFSTLRKLGGGSQDWRVVTMMITPDALFWGSDNDTSSGADIFRYGFSDGRLAKIRHLGKVAYYSTVLSDGTLALSTAYEPDSPYVRDHRPPASADLWVSIDGREWDLAASFPYEPGTRRDGKPTRAWITFPGGEAQQLLMFTPINTSVHDFNTKIAQTIRRPLR